MNFFQYYGQIEYQFTDANNSSLHYGLLLTDFTKRAVIQERLKMFVSAYYDYVIADGERPDNTATRLYGDPRYTWIVLLVNNINSPYDWPLSTDEFNAYMSGKYGTLSRAQATTTDADYYFDTAGELKTANEYAALPLLERGKVLPARYCYTVDELLIDSASYNALPVDTRGVVKTPYAYEQDINESRRRIKAILPQFLGQISREIKTLLV